MSIPRPLHTPVALIGILCNFVPAPPAVAEPAALRLEDLYLSPPTATPLRTAPLAFVPETGLAASWSPQFDFPPSGAGLSSSVNALTVYNGELIAAGDFDRAGGIVAGRVAAWNGATWSPLRTGLNDRAFAATVWNGLLVVGGKFARADGLPVGAIAAWDGAQWSGLGSTGGDVYALTTFKGDLVAGGAFSGGVKIWDGSTWTVPGVTTGPGLPGVVLALATYTAGGTEYLVAGGSFRSGSSLNNVAKWNGSSWSGLGTGASDWVAAAYARSDTLFVGGRFDFVNGTTVARRIARWVPSGSSGTWSAIGSASGSVLALADYAGSLVAGGELQSMSGTLVNQVGAWNGTGWNSLGTGTGGPLFRPIVRCAASFNGTLFVGGWFTLAGGTSSRFLANWTAPPPGPSPSEPTFVASEGMEPSRSSLALAPNPFRSNLDVRFHLSQDGPTRVAVYGSGGRLVAVLADGARPRGAHTVRWDGRDETGRRLPGGVYFLSVRTSEGVSARKAVLAR